jgi:hypothetical protein
MCWLGRGQASLWFSHSWLCSAARHGQRPFISTTTDQLRNVRITTSAPNIATFLGVRSSATVRMTSAATRNSSPNKSELPISSFYSLKGSFATFTIRSRKRAEPNKIEPTMAITASHSIPSDAISIHSRMLCTCYDYDLGEEPRVSRFVSRSSRSEITRCQKSQGGLDSEPLQK